MTLVSPLTYNPFIRVQYEQLIDGTSTFFYSAAQVEF